MMAWVYTGTSPSSTEGATWSWRVLKYSLCIQGRQSECHTDRVLQCSLHHLLNGGAWAFSLQMLVSHAWVIWPNQLALPPSGNGLLPGVLASYTNSYAQGVIMSVFWLCPVWISLYRLPVPSVFLMYLHGFHYISTWAPQDFSTSFVLTTPCEFKPILQRGIWNRESKHHIFKGI